MRPDPYRIRLGRGRAYRDPGIARKYHRPVVAATVHDSGRVSSASPARTVVPWWSAARATLPSRLGNKAMSCGRAAIEAGLVADGESKHSPRLVTWEPGLRVRKDPDAERSIHHDQIRV
jgi:hypothetical protein